MQGISARSAALVAMAMAFTPLTASAGTDTDTLSVTATVQTSCALNGGTMSFGQYMSGQTTDLDVTGTITYINCGVGTLTFELDGGSSGDPNDREMTSGENVLKYELHRNSTRNAIWGTGANARQVQLLQAVPSGTVDVYGRIPKNQAVAAGTYTDTVNITLTF